LTFDLEIILEWNTSKVKDQNQKSKIKNQKSKMLTIALMRMGAKKNPFYRVVVREKRAKRDGKYVENVGTYNPMPNPAEVNLKIDRIDYWLKCGAQPTDTVRSLIRKEKEKAQTTE
jgi:small subunit ribosomal protein S16